jgi:hypothetical protein
MRDGPLARWSIAIDAFPLTGSPPEQLAALIPFAILAPSICNSQPWLFRLSGDVLELREDPRRRLPVSDPENRELVISCGAALAGLEIALHNFGYASITEICPDPAEPELLARIVRGNHTDPLPAERRLFDAITRRHTYRGTFLPRVIEPDLMDEFEFIASRHEAWFHILQSDAHRELLADLVTEGDRTQMSDPLFREELAGWLRPARSSSPDGMPGPAFGFNTAQSLVLPLVVRTFDTGGGKAAHDSELALGSPLLAIFATERDTRKDWVRTGQALMRILLRATSNGVAASFLNQPIEVTALRARVAALLGSSVYPQLIVRMGHPADEVIRHTPRRAIEDVVEGSNDAAQ